MRARKRPVTVDVIQFTKRMAEGNDPLPDGVRMVHRSTDGNGRFPNYVDNGMLQNYENCHTHLNKTQEDDMKVQIGDCVITGVAGEFYPCKPDIFDKTYEILND